MLDGAHEGDVPDPLLTTATDDRVLGERCVRAFRLIVVPGLRGEEGWGFWWCDHGPLGQRPLPGGDSIGWRIAAPRMGSHRRMGGEVVSSGDEKVGMHHLTVLCNLLKDHVLLCVILT